MINKPILVTGASGGIGEALVHSLAAKDYSIIALGRNKEEFEDKFKDLKQCVCLSADLNQLQKIPSLIKKVKSKYGKIRGMVHCAGFDKLGPLYLARIDDISALFNIHVMAPMLMCSQIAKKGNAAEGCAVVLISSLAAHEGAMGHTSYAAAKGALEGYLPSAAAELADRGIRINIVIPGVVKTRMSAGYLDKMDPEQKSALEKSYPLGLGEPEDVANAIVFLLSDDSKWITGQTLIIDGGHMCRKA